MRKTHVFACVVVAALWAGPSTAEAFCGFYVAGADAKLYNNATQVVLMREGTLTVLSMQNNYQGPAEDFAMVIPVPQVLSEDNVKTLERAVFDRVDTLAAPRLVEYWEQDPCEIRRPRRKESGRGGAAKKDSDKDRASGAEDLGVTVEAEFTVGEYDIVILSAKESTGLETWLNQNNYKIPADAAPLLEPYVAGGMKFFVAKVDPTKVTFEGDQALLSPLRFHYESETFTLPIRLGLINANDKQDLIVHILAKGKRYEVSNYSNVTIPTNFDVKDEARDRFAEFYAALFDSTLEKHAGAVVTEYSWDASSCDPCPSPPLSANDIETLGNDVILGAKGDAAAPATGANSKRPGRGSRRPRRSGFVLTRLHARYDAGSVGDDLVFVEAKAIAGGRERRDGDGALEHGAVDSSVNNFQARYAIRHEWTGPIECANPQRGIWGGPPKGKQKEAVAARDTAFAPRGRAGVSGFLARDLADLDIKATVLEPAAGAGPGATDTDTGANAEPDPETPATEDEGGADPKKEKKGGCGCSGSGGSAPAGLLIALAVLVAVTRRSSHA